MMLIHFSQGEMLIAHLKEFIIVEYQYALVILDYIKILQHI